jgi:hypothetical protein
LCAARHPALAVDRPYDFIVKPQLSGLDADAGLTIGTSGTLVGNYHATDNPTGTRTKPGLFSPPFGPQDNDPVPVMLGVQAGGPVQTQTGGLFRMTLNPEAGTAGITDLSLDFVSAGPLGLPVVVGLSFDTFRTRSPTFLYPGGTLDLPIGTAEVTALIATQVGPAGVGTLTPSGADEYDFTVGLAVELTGSLDLLGTPFDLPPTPVPLVLSGSLVLDGSGDAHLTSSQPLTLMNTQNPDIALPQFAFDLPTLDPSNPAHILFDLTLDDVSTEFDGTLALAANGVLVPEPATGVLFALAGGAAGRPLRRMRRHCGVR